MDKLTTVEKERLKYIIRNIGFSLLIGCASFIVYFLVNLLINRWGINSYTFDWVVRRKLFLTSSIIAACPSVFGKYRFSCSTFIGNCLGILSGDTFGKNPAGAEVGLGHYGWLIYCVVFFVSVLVGILLEILCHRNMTKKAKS